MSIFRGKVETARQDLIDAGASPQQAGRVAPRLAADRQAQEDSRTRPYPWLGDAGWPKDGAR